MSTSCSAKNLSQSAALCSCSSWSHSEGLLSSRFDYPVPMLPAPACSRECNRGQSEARPDDTRESLIEILEISKDSSNGVKSIDFRFSRNHGNRSTQASIKFLLVGPRIFTFVTFYDYWSCWPTETWSVCVSFAVFTVDAYFMLLYCVLTVWLTGCIFPDRLLTSNPTLTHTYHYPGQFATENLIPEIDLHTYSYSRRRVPISITWWDIPSVIIVYAGRILINTVRI